MVLSGKMLINHKQIIYNKININKCQRVEHTLCYKYKSIVIANNLWYVIIDNQYKINKYKEIVERKMNVT